MIKILNEYLDSSKIALEKFEELEFRKVNENIVRKNLWFIKKSDKNRSKRKYKE